LSLLIICGPSDLLLVVVPLWIIGLEVSNGIDHN